MMEVTNDVSSLIPLMITTCISRFIADSINIGIYDDGINMKAFHSFYILIHSVFHLLSLNLLIISNITMYAHMLTHH